MNKNNSTPHIDICLCLAHNMLDDENAITKSMEESQSAFQNIRNGDSINIKTRITRQIVAAKAMSSLKSVYKDKIHTSTISSILEELNDVATLSERYPKENVIGLQLSDMLDKYVRTLSSEELTIYIKRYFYADSISDIAKSLNATEEKIVATLQRCNSDFNELLSEKEHIVSAETLFLSFTDIDDDIINLKVIQNANKSKDDDSFNSPPAGMKKFTPFIIALPLLAIIIFLLVNTFTDGTNGNSNNNSNNNNNFDEPQIDKRFLHIFESMESPNDFVNIEELLKYQQLEQEETNTLPINSEHFKIQYKKLDLMNYDMLPYCVGELFDDTTHDNRVYFKLRGHEGLQYIIQKEFNTYTLYVLDSYKLLHGLKDEPFKLALEEIFNIHDYEDIDNLSCFYYDGTDEKNIDSPEEIATLYHYIQAITPTGAETQTQLKNGMCTTGQLIRSSTLLTITSATGESCNLWYRYDHQYFYDFAGAVYNVIDYDSHAELKAILGFPDSEPIPKYNPYKPETWNVDMELISYSAWGFELKFVHPYGIETVDLETVEFFYLEKYIDGSWVPMDCVASPTALELYKTMKRTIPKNQMYIFNNGFPELYIDSKNGQLAPGYYRIGKDITNIYMPEDSNVESLSYRLYVEFEIEEVETEDTSEEIKYGN